MVKLRLPKVFRFVQKSFIPFLIGAFLYFPVYAQQQAALSPREEAEVLRLLKNQSALMYDLLQKLKKTNLESYWQNMSMLKTQFEKMPKDQTENRNARSEEDSNIDKSVLIDEESEILAFMENESPGSTLPVVKLKRTNNAYYWQMLAFHKIRMDRAKDLKKTDLAVSGRLDRAQTMQLEKNKILGELNRGVISRQAARDALYEVLRPFYAENYSPKSLAESIITVKSEIKNAEEADQIISTGNASQRNALENAKQKVVLLEKKLDDLLYVQNHGLNSYVEFEVDNILAEVK